MKTALLSILLLGFSPIIYAQNALDFDGNDDVVQTNYTGVLGSADRTFEAIVFVSSSAPSSNLAILDYGTNAVGSRNTFAVSGSRALTFISGGTNANISSPASSVPVNQWVHVALVIDNSVGFLYVNGVQVGTGSLSTVNTPAGNENVKIGQRVSGGSIPFQGGIDEVRIWNDVRTPAELQANMMSELCTLDPNLQLYLRLNEGTAGGNNLGVTSALEESGNGHTATLSGFALNGATSNWIVGSAITPGISSSNTVVSECDSYIWSATGTTYTTTGIYSTVLSGANANGCDSTLILDLSIFTANDLTTNVSECDSYTWSVNGQTYTTSTTVVEPLTTSQGCAYNHTLNLTIGTSSSDTSTVNACDSYTWSANNQIYTASGTYTETYTNQSGCDSIVTLELAINTVDNTATDNGDLSMTANDATASYQWLDCDNGFSIIAGATSQTYTTTTDGNFAVEVTANGCVDTSACITIDYANLDFLDLYSHVSLYPNPTNSGALLSFGETIASANITVTDASGRNISKHTILNQKELLLDFPSEAGVYFVCVKTIDQRSLTLRLVKE